MCTLHSKVKESKAKKDNGRLHVISISCPANLPCSLLRPQVLQALRLVRWMNELDEWVGWVGCVGWVGRVGWVG